MQVKTYIGNSTKEVLDAIKNELGSDAVILSSRERQKDGRRVYEITAGAERTEQTSAKDKASSAVPSGWDDWHKEWSKLKEQIYLLMQPSLQLDKLSPHQRVALEYLQREGVENEVIVQCYNLLLAHKAEEASMLKVLASLVSVKSFTFENYPQRLHIITGPYGVGKTSTVLRLALLRKVQVPHHRVAFINTDSLRGNGRVVLRHWADLSGFPYFEAPDKESMYGALKAYLLTCRGMPKMKNWKISCVCLVLILCKPMYILQFLRIINI